MSLLTFIGRQLARFLTRPGKAGKSFATSPPNKLAATLKKGDVLLVEGTNWIAGGIRYVTQSTWSHAALYIGDASGQATPGQPPRVLLEADVIEGVRAVPLSLYESLHTRICRPVGLSASDIDAVIRYALSHMGDKYDLKNIFDLARYLIPTPPVSARWRRRLLALGSGDPTRAICSSLIAQAFQSVRYPILPEIILDPVSVPDSIDTYKEYLHIRHHSLFVPRDFDVSPYFQVIKPEIEHGFDFRQLVWQESGQIESGDTHIRYR